MIFGCRFNKIKDDFEKLLGSFKAAGAELLFVSKKSNLDKDEDIRLEQLNEDYTLGINFVKELSKNESTREVNADFFKFLTHFLNSNFYSSVIVLRSSDFIHGKTQRSLFWHSQQ